MELDTFEILVGTYEEFVLGYKISPKLKCEGEYELAQSFTSRAHCGPVRSLVSVGKYLVSGGSDEICKVYDLASRVEHGQLMHHEGTVSCLASHGKTFLLTAADDNTLAVVRTGSWQVEKTLYKHQAGITALAVHPTGKLAFTAGKDRKLITWNLVKARPAFITNLKGIAEFLVSSPDGSRYCVGIHRRVDVYSIESAAIEYTVDLKCRPNCLVFLDNNTIVVGGESPTVQVHSLIEKTLLKEFQAHETRVRCMLVVPEGKAEETGERVVATVSSSDHMLKLWRISSSQDKEVVCVGSVDTTCRITCLSLWHPSMREAKKKRKKGAGQAANTSSDPKAGKPPPGKKAKLSFAVSEAVTGDKTGNGSKSKAELIVVEELGGGGEATSGGKKGKKKKRKSGGNDLNLSQ